MALTYQKKCDDMELKDFVKKVILDLDQAVSEANQGTTRVVRFARTNENRTALEFDVAVTVESTASGNGGGAIRVWGIGEIGAKGVLEQKNSTVSRVQFGVDVSHSTKQEDAQHEMIMQGQFLERHRINPAI